MRWFICLFATGCMFGDNGERAMVAVDASASSTDAETTTDALVGDDVGTVVTTLSQSTDTTTIVAGNSAACAYSTGEMGTAENHYYRAFRLAEHGVTRPFALESVSFGVQRASSSTGMQRVYIRAYRYAHAALGVTLVESAMEQLASYDLQLANTSGSIVTVPLVATLAADATLVVEVFSPDHPNDSPTAGTEFLIGSNTAGQQRASYVKMPGFLGCAINVPTTTDSVGYTSMHVVMTATGRW